MRKVLNIIRDYFCYCGISKDEYNAVKKDAYISNYNVWQFIHVLMAGAFGLLFIGSLINDTLKQNMLFYLVPFIYSVVSALLFLFVLKKDAIVSQLYIYLSIVVLFLFGAFVTSNKPNDMAVTFMVMLIITPMFMLDRPFFMSFVLVIASIVFLVWMKQVKPYEVWFGDLVDTIAFCLIGIFLHIIANSIRIKEFVLTKKINEQKDLDDLTGLQNKGALTRCINEFLSSNANKGILFMLDIDGFKSINDTFGHDVGDDVIRQVGEYLKTKFSKSRIVGRFGGDEFIIFIENEDDLALASRLAREVSADITKYIRTPDPNQRIHVSQGIAIYRGEEKNYSEIFKKADIALYNTKNEGKDDYQIY